MVCDNDSTPDNLQKLNNARIRHTKYVNHVVQYWRQKSAFKWLREGDCNSKLFHQSVKIKRAALRIHRIQNSKGQWLEDPKEIVDAGVNYFKELLSDYLLYDASYWNSLNMELERCVPKLVTSADNDILQAIPEIDEIRQVVFSLNSESSAGTDGYT